MEELRPDEELEAREFEEATNSKWQRPQLPKLTNRPRVRVPKFSELEWAINKWVIGIAVILVLLFGGRWLHHVLKTETPAKRPTTTQTPVATNQSAGSTAATSSTSAAQSGTQATQSSQVPNTGPGSTLATFVVLVALASGLHYFAYSQKAKR